MEVREVTERFPCGEVEETFADYILVSWVMWLFFGAVATWAVWHSQRGVVWNHIAIDYIIVGFCVWRMTRQRRPLVYVCEKGIVIRRGRVVFGSALTCSGMVTITTILFRMLKLSVLPLIGKKSTW